MNGFASRKIVPRESPGLRNTEASFLQSHSDEEYDKEEGGPGTRQHIPRQGRLQSRRVHGLRIRDRMCPQLFVLLSALLQLVSCVAESSEQITSRLLDNYGATSVRPAVAAAERSALAAGSDGCLPTAPPPEAVETQLYIDQFQPLNMDKQTWALDGYLRAWWHDVGEFNGTASNETEFWLQLHGRAQFQDQ